MRTTKLRATKLLSYVKRFPYKYYYSIFRPKITIEEAKKSDWGTLQQWLDLQGRQNADILEASHCTNFVAKQRSVIAGYVQLLHLDRKGSDKFWLNSLIVKNNYRRFGIGTMLCHAVIETSIREGCHVLYLRVRESNIPAVKLYLKLGFLVEKNEYHHSNNHSEKWLVMKRSC